MLLAEFQRELDRRETDGADGATLEVEIVPELRQKLCAGQYVSAGSSCAPISVELVGPVASCPIRTSI
jgi:hypothetical protein